MPATEVYIDRVRALAGLHHTSVSSIFDPEILRLCLEALHHVAHLLGTPPLKIMWVMPGTPGIGVTWNAAPARTGAGRWHRVVPEVGPERVGWVRLTVPDTLYIVYQTDLSLDLWRKAAPLIVLHEARHAWQHLNGIGGTKAEQEADATQWGIEAYREHFADLL
jgi:hypothetical protein